MQWRVWWVLASNDIKQRYRRSRLGQFWLTISMAATIAGVGIVFGVIFNQPIGQYLPFVGIGFIVWNLLSGLINELAGSFISSDTYLRSYPSPRSVMIYRTIARNFLIAAHNVVLVPILMLAFGIPLTPAFLLLIPGIFLVVLNGVWAGMLLGPLCARFRDLPQIVANITQLAFFITPVVYRPSQLEERLWVVTHLNPLASFMELLREPTLGNVPDLHHYLLVLLCTTAGFAIAFPFYARFRGRILYWI
jgi:ABC-type polysaccharide/polyol phosphate export permease